MNNEEKKQLKLAAVDIRKGIMASTHAAKSGHPGGSLSSADIIAYLYFKQMRIDPKDPKWPYKTHGVFPLENSYTESKMLKLKSTKKYPIYIYRRTSLQTDNADIFYAKIKFPEE